ncbi:glycosyltransferase [Pseudalkalibacillus caeni]|uniref:Glycosyltransferase family 2 protein n=1 Tax=Exobacillus caeni TaxID=2574798 RepID=A0A5R9EYL9_9BACL|nr:glycosyltransferase family 2 protein [Pseudalkalibacillus caeni]TLS35160.1 glycosyltransferase family 2 protein [Pseudalkalibacillus caeni]
MGVLVNSKYAIISAVRNEAEIIKSTLNSVVHQELTPHKWVIVDDGSTDGTTQILKEYEREYSWIEVIEKNDRGHAKLGGGVVESFNVGLKEIDFRTIDYIVKLDGDLEFESDYFKSLISKFENNPKLGIASGLTYFKSSNNSLVKENAPLHYAIGPSKVYRVSCFKEINGLVQDLGWDVIDVIRAQSLGWETRNFPELKLLHLRPMSSKAGIMRGRFRNGLTDYLTGYHPLFLTARSIYRLFHYPYIFGGIMIFSGYVYGQIKVRKQLVTATEKKFIQKQQLKRLLGIKPVRK